MEVCSMENRLFVTFFSALIALHVLCKHAQTFQFRWAHTTAVDARFTNLVRSSLINCTPPVAWKIFQLLLRSISSAIMFSRADVDLLWGGKSVCHLKEN